MNKIIILLAICFLPSMVSGQEDDKESTKNEFGFHVGASTGIGLSYRRWISNQGIQLTFVPVMTDEIDFISGGLTLMHSFRNKRYFRFFGYLGNHIIYNTEFTDEYLHYNIGLGPGFEFGTVLRFNLMVGYGFYNVTNDINMFPCGEIGLYYNF
ncbi:MAG: hypothetical protein PVF73_11175 [Bacteroidales bacterium]|jgi:hypothetical protein